MAAYRQSQSICRALYAEATDGGGKGLSAKALFCRTLEESPKSNIFNADLLFTESLKYALSEGRVVALGADGMTYALAEGVLEDMTPRAEGVISTNADSKRCELCSEWIVGPQLSVGDVLICCGRRICASCFNTDREIATDSAGESICSVCGDADLVSGPEKKRYAKRLAKRGVPWASLMLGTAKYDGNEYVVGSPYEAVRYLRKAASAGSPEALFHLARHYGDGTGCIQNVEEALVCLERCKTIDPEYEDFVNAYMAYLSGCLVNDKRIDLARMIFERLAIVGHVKAQAALGVMYGGDDSIDTAREHQWYMIAALNAPNEKKHCLTIARTEVARFFCLQGQPGQARFFLKQAFVLREGCGGEEVLLRAHSLLQGLHATKAICSGCGISLPDKRARFTCRQCRAVCYCSRSCQKRHWNCTGGHADDCKSAERMKMDLLHS